MFTETRFLSRHWCMLGVLCLACLLCVAAPRPASAEETKTIDVTNERLDITFAYPVLGQERIDADLKKWAEETVAAFVDESAENASTIPYEMKGEYSLVRASDKTVTVVWNVWAFTGGAHGMLDITTFTYDAVTGQPLDLQSLFSNVDSALNVFSAYSMAALSEKLGDMYVEDMVKSGTSPDLDNFSAVAPTSDGVRLFFQPYQVAPWAAGAQEVEVPLSELDEAEPRLIYWGRTQ